jgi:CRP/FNR family cyclic AMP-dependent transcriptional regulator
MDFPRTLAKTFLFKDFPSEDIERLANIAIEEKRPQESIVFHENDHGNQFYVIVLGSVGIIKKNREGADEEIATLSTGSYFGEMAIVDDDHVRSATVVTKESTTLLVFSQPSIQKLFANDDRLAHHFYRSLARGLSRRLRSTTIDASFYKALVKHRHG